MAKVTAGFLGDAVLAEDFLTKPEAFDLLACVDLVVRSDFGIGTVGREVDVCGRAAEEFLHGFVV